MDKVFVKYTNQFTFNGRTLSFKNKILFDITGTPTRINVVNNSGVFGWYVNRKFLSKNYAEGLIKMQEVEKDISNLQWFQKIDIQKPKL